MFSFLLLLLVGVGLVIGLVARTVVPGQDQLGVPGTIVLGVGGSLVGGLVGNLVIDGIGFGMKVAFTLFAVAGAVFLLLAYRVVRGIGGRTGSPS